MGLWDYFNRSEGDRRAEEVRTGAVAPSRAERQRCYVARDAYFACLDASGIVDPLKEDKRAAAACGRQDADFSKDCAAQWVTYFKKWRVQDIQKRARLKELEEKGASQVDIQSGVSSLSKRQ